MTWPRDFATVGAIGSVPNVLIIAPSKGFKTVQEYVAAAKANPSSLNFASVGVGSAVHLSAERFRLSAGYEAVHVPYKGGAEAITEMIAGRIDFYFCPIATGAAVHPRGPAARARGQQPETGDGAAGYADHIGGGLSGRRLYVLDGRVRAQPRPRREIVAKLNQEPQKALQAPAVKEKLATLGVEAMPLTAAEFDDQVKKEIGVLRHVREGGRLDAELTPPGHSCSLKARSWFRSRRRPLPWDC